MAFLDWNQNGKNDLQDDFLEYNIYKNCTQGKHNNSNYNNNGPSSFWVAVIVIGMIFLVASLLESCEPKCIVSDCDNRRSDDSSYCYLHNDYHSISNSYKYSTSYGNSSSYYSNETTTSESYIRTTQPVTTRQYNSIKREKQTKKYKDDPYDVYEYSDEEDFYYDNYDDFESYEDAEDYYDEAWDEY